MKIDHITDINVLREALKEHMVYLIETIDTPTGSYSGGEWYNYIADDDEVFIFEDHPNLGIVVNYDEYGTVWKWGDEI